MSVTITDDIYGTRYDLGDLSMFKHLFKPTEIIRITSRKPGIRKLRLC